MKHSYYAQEIYYLKALNNFFFQKKVVGGQPPVNYRRVGGKHNTVKQADSGLGGWMLRNFQREPLKPDHVLMFCQGFLPHDLVTGEIPHAGPRQPLVTLPLRASILSRCVHCNHLKYYAISSEPF